MSEKKVHAIVLAAGKSTRFGTDKPKLLHKLCGQEMILYPTKLLEKLNIETSVVVGHQKELIQSIIVKHHLQNINFIHQDKQLGTGHAILCSQPTWNKEHILILNGDVPLITPEIIEELYTKHITNKADISFVIAHNVDPTITGYGRVIQTDNSIEIIESKEFTADTSEHCCINAGIYLAKRSFLEENINNIKKSEKCQEFYLTDLIKIASEKECKIETVLAPFDRIRGINTFKELWIAEQIKRAELIVYWMERGVRFSVAQNVHIDLNVTLGQGTYIGAGVQIFNNSRIGNNCRIECFSKLESATIGDNVKINSHCNVKNSQICSNSIVGPFAYISDHTTISEYALIGSFVEINKSFIGKKSKIKQQSFLEEAQVGANAIVGAGTVICNQENSEKNITKIEENAYIGENSTLISPVIVGKNAFAAAGSVIIKDIPNNALAVARSKQVIKNDYAKKIKGRKFKTAIKISSANP